MITVRLDPNTETALARLAAERGQTKSDVIRDALERLAEEAGPGETAYARLRAYVGVVDSGGLQLSTRTGRRLRELLEERRRASGSR